MSNDNKYLVFENFCVDRQQRILLHNNKHLPLTPKAFDILLVLIESRDRIVSKNELMERVWQGIAVEEGNIVKNISHLRKILANGDGGNDKEKSEQDNNKYIVTISKRGYRFVHDVQEISTDTLESFTAPNLPSSQNVVEVEENNHNGNAVPQEQIPQPTVFSAHKETDSLKSRTGFIRRLSFPLILLLTGVFAGAIAVSIIIVPLLKDAVEIEDTDFHGWKTEQGPDLLRLSTSPDGKFIAYSKNVTGQLDIHINSVLDSQARAITNDEWTDYSPIWSPDSNQVAYLSNRSKGVELWVISMLGGSGEKIDLLNSAQVRLLHWSTDKEKIFYTDLTGLYSINLASRAKTKLNSFGKDAMVETVSISPNEKSIAYSAKSNNRFHIFIAGIDGTAEQQITTGGEHNASPVWFPDGKRILYTSKKGDFYQVHIVQVGSAHKDRILHNRRSARLVQITPDGKTIFYQALTGESDIYRMELASGNEDQLASQTLLEIFPEVSPNGEAIVFYQANPESNILQGKIFIQSASIKDRILATIPNSFDAHWAKDSGQVAFLRSNLVGTNTLWVAANDGSDLRQVTEMEVVPNGFSQQPYGWAQPYNFSWSPVTDLLAFSSIKSGALNIWTVSAKSRAESLTEKMISDNTDPKLMAICPIWSPAGNQLAYLIQGASNTRDPRRIMVHRFDTESGGEQMLYQTYTLVRMIGWLANGEDFLFGESIQEKAGSKITNLYMKQTVADQKDAVLLKQLTSVYFNSLCLSPKRDCILYVARQNNCDNIWYLSLKDRQAKQLTNNKDPLQHFATLAWSPDQKSIYFSKQIATTEIRTLKNFD